MKTFVELVQEIKKSFDKDDRTVLANLEDSIELTSTASTPHAVGTYLIYNKVIYEVTSTIQTGDTLTPGTNIDVAADIMSLLDNVKQALTTLTNKEYNDGVKNLLPNKAVEIYRKSEFTIAGNVTATVNSDGSVNLNGNSTSAKDFAIVDDKHPLYLKAGQYKLSGTPASGGDRIYISEAHRYNPFAIDTGSGTTFTITNELESNGVRVYISISNSKTYSNVLYKPMITVADAPDSDYAHYQPYAKPNTELTQDDNGLTANAFANGAVNMCPITITSQTVDTGGTDVTIVVNSDGTFTANGTVTNDTNVNVTDVLVNFLKAGKRYKLSGSPSGSSASTYRLYISGSGGGYDNGDGYEFTLEQLTSSARVRLSLCAGATLSNVVFKPMITVADMPNSDYNHYVPYAKSNKELTDELAIKTATVPVYTHADESVSYATLKKTGNVVNIDIQIMLGENDTPLSATQLGQVPSEYRPPSTLGAQAISLRTAAAWANATYINAYITVTSGGYITLRGKDTELATGKYLSGSITYII